MKKRRTLSITLVLSLLMALMTTGMAFASEGNEVEVTGTIYELFPEEFYLVVEAEIDGEIVYLEVEVGQNFNFEAYDIGDLIELKGTLNEEGRLVITELKIQERARDRVKTQAGEGEAQYCIVEDQFHPVALKIADTYGVEYSELEGYLCGEDHIPLGQIMLALATAQLSEDYDFTDFLDGFEHINWGKIWMDLDLQGKPGHGTPPGQIKKQDGDGGDGGQSDQAQGGK